MRFKSLLIFSIASLLASAFATAALTVPTDVQMPGTQPEEVPERLTAAACDSCHADYDPGVEPVNTWRGSMMAHSGRDPVFWAALAIAEQTFDGAGDYCIRCHSPGGWADGRSTPTDGSALNTDDIDGVTCHVCHTITNPDDSEFVGVQNAPFVATDGGTPAKAYIGSGQYVMLFEDIRLGPYSDPAAPHNFGQSAFHRSNDVCGTCHDVSNPFTGDLAPNNGAKIALAPGTFSDALGAPIGDKAAFNNFPFQYGIVERTYSEHFSSAFATLAVSDYATLPAELQAGSIADAYNAALIAGNGGDYEDGTTRFFSCQSCHMKPVMAKGAAQGFAPVRGDMPLHDLTGGNYWTPNAIQYLHAEGIVQAGDPVDSDQIADMDAGALRAIDNLQKSAALSITGNVLRVVNLTGHKLISGYPEGRRMWLNVKWYDGANALIREDGAYGSVMADIGGTPTPVDTLLDLSGTNTKIYEAEHAITQDWAAELITLGVPASTPLGYDRLTGAITKTLGQLAAEPAGSYEKTFHFILNNDVVADNRIPPYGLRYDDASERNALPVPETQYGDPGAGGVYDYFDEVTLNPPAGAATAQVELKYQPTSWEYIQFLARANDGSNAFLASTGTDLLDAWLNTGMAAPQTMASIGWVPSPDNDGDGVPDVNDNCADVANPVQCDTDGDGNGNRCDGDLDNSGGIVGFADLLAFKTAFGTTDPDADLDCSGGVVNFADLFIFKELFGMPPG